MLWRTLRVDCKDCEGSGDQSAGTDTYGRELVRPCMNCNGTGEVRIRRWRWPRK